MKNGEKFFEVFWNLFRNYLRHFGWWNSLLHQKIAMEVSLCVAVESFDLNGKFDWVLWRDRRLFVKSLQRSSWQSSILRVFAEESAEFDFFFIFSNRRLQTISTNLTNYSAQKFGNHLPHSESSQRLRVKFFEFSTWEFISKTSLESLLEILFKVLFEIF